MRKPVTAILLMIFLAVSLSGCGSYRPRVGPPWKQKMLLEGPKGPAKFQEGWRHGCETGISASSNHLQKQFYNFKQDYKLAQDPAYYTGWRVAFMYCQRYIFQYLAREYF